MRGGVLESEARSILNVKPKASDAEVKEVRTFGLASPTRRAPRAGGRGWTSPELWFGEN